MSARIPWRSEMPDCSTIAATNCAESDSKITCLSWSAIACSIAIRTANPSATRGDRTKDKKSLWERNLSFWLTEKLHPNPAVLCSLLHAASDRQRATESASIFLGVTPHFGGIGTTWANFHSLASMIAFDITSWGVKWRCWKILRFLGNKKFSMRIIKV